MRWVMAWLVSGPMKMTGEWVGPGDGNNTAAKDSDCIPLPGYPAFALTLAVFWAFLLLAVHLWSLKVEPMFAAATIWFEDLAWGKKVVAVNSGALLMTQRYPKGWKLHQ
jgi:hypothetical protein